MGIQPVAIQARIRLATVKNPLQQKEIERPLGLDRSKRKTRYRRLFSGSFSRRGQLVFVASVIAIIAASTAIALRDRPFRSPAQIIVSTPVISAANDEKLRQVEAAYPRRNDNKTGPSIIHVQPPAHADREENGNVIVIRDPSSLTQDLRLAHLPDRTLIEETDIGPLPIRSTDGRRPFDVYAGKWSGTRGAKVAIIIGGLGVSQTGTQVAISALPPQVTLAFASGGNSLDRWMQAARREGHEIIMQIPLEPFDYPSVNPGRNTMTIDAEPAENRDRLYHSLSRITNYTGVMNYMGARFVTDEAAMTPFFTELGQRGLMYLDDGSSSKSLAHELALQQRVPYVAADLVIDNERDRGTILKRLDEAERIARAQGQAVAIGSAFDVTIDALGQWIREASSRGIEIVPVSALAYDPENNR